MAPETVTTGQRPPIRRQARPGVHPTGGAAPESPEVPTPDEVQPRPAEPSGFEVPPMGDEKAAPTVDLERPPGPAVMWQHIRAMEPKVETMWLARQNQARRPPGTATWACAFEIQPGLKCGHQMLSTPAGQPKEPPLVCPDHGQSPHELVE